MTAPRLAMILALAALVVLVAPAAAQTPFASLGLGQNVEMNSARDVGRGGWGMADSDSLAPGTMNQAALADLQFTGLFFAGYGERTSSYGADSQRRTYRTVLPNVRLAVPLSRGRLSLHAGFLIKRSMEWTSRSEIERDHFGETVRGIERYQRTGTLYHVPLGLAWRPLGGLALGASYNVVRGSIDDQITQLFTDPLDNYYLPNTREQSDQLSGGCVTGSVLFDALRVLQLGASVTTSYDLEMDREISLAGVAERTGEPLMGSMPAEYRAGVMVRLPNHWRFGADGQLARFSEFTGRPDWEPILHDEWTLSAGLERTWVRTQFGRSYDMPIRLGFQWRQWAHTVGGSPVDERTISAGTGFPFRNRLGMIDVSLSYSWLGDTARNGYRSETWRLGLSITGLEALVF